jgi:hypothetical protein
MTVPIKKVEIEIDPNSGLQPFFTLDSATYGILDDPSGQSILGSLAYVDVSNWVANINVDRGISRELDRYDAGRVSVTFDNTTREFDPLNSSSPFAEQLLPRRGIRVYSGGTPVFFGLVEDWNLNYNPNGDNTSVAVGSDKFTLLAKQNIDVRTNSQELSGSRINTILSLPEVDWPISERVIDVGQTTMQADTIAEGTEVLDYLNLVSESEFGSLFITKNGYIEFQDSSTGPDSSNLLIFADDNSGVPFTDLDVVYGGELLYNRVSITRLGGTVQTVDDLTSQTFYGITTYSADGLLMTTDIEAESYANKILNRYSNPEYRFDTLTIEMAELNSTQQTQVLQRELTDTVQIKFTPNSIGAQINKYAQIIGISHNINNFSHRVTFRFATWDFAPFVLDDTVFGVLNSYGVG